REVDRVQPGRAETVDLDARHAVAIAGSERGGARDVAARLADRIDAAEHHIGDERGVELRAVADRAPTLGGKVEPRDLVQGAVGLAAAARRANVIVDIGVGHLVLPRRCVSPETPQGDRYTITSPKNRARTRRTVTGCARSRAS